MPDEPVTHYPQRCLKILIHTPPRLSRIRSYRGVVDKANAKPAGISTPQSRSCRLSHASGLRCFLCLRKYLESIVANRRRDLGIAFESARRLGLELAFNHGIDLGRGEALDSRQVRFAAVSTLGHDDPENPLARP